jgi:hypothetical protein
LLKFYISINNNNEYEIKFYISINNNKRKWYYKIFILFLFF